MRGQKKGFRHTDETKARISATMQGRRPNGTLIRKPCPLCGTVQNVANLPRHKIACAEAARLSPLLGEILTPRRLKAIRIRVRAYGLTIDDYAQLMRKQGGQCGICAKSRRLGVDHCHKSGRVRGLLCNDCNFFLGLAEDDPHRLQAAIAYLK